MGSGGGIMTGEINRVNDADDLRPDPPQPWWGSLLVLLALLILVLGLLRYLT